MTDVILPVPGAPVGQGRSHRRHMLEAGWAKTHCLGNKSRVECDDTFSHPWARGNGVGWGRGLALNMHKTSKGDWLWKKPSYSFPVSG